MSRRPKSSQSVALFPFLAVLVCTMGALIFLLLVTTRMIRDQATAEAVAEASLPPQLPLLNVASTEEPPSPPPLPPPVVIEEAEEPPEPTIDVRAVAVEQRQRELDALTAQWQGRVDELNAARNERVRLLSQRQQLSKAAAQRVAAMQAELHDLEIKLGRMTGELSASAVSPGTSKEQIELETQIRELKRRLRAAQQSSGDDKFEVVPFDIVTGTSRRPILIECTATGLRFIPEDIRITPDDLVGFTPHVNPLVVGAGALVNYWTAWNIRQPNPSREPEPYVLLLVRPSGTIAYYVAMKMMVELKQPHGYELIEEDTVLQMPPVDAGAKAACEAAIKRLLAERNQALRQAGVGGFGGGRGRFGGGAGSGGDGGLGGGGGNRPVGAREPAGGTGGDQAGPGEFELSDIVDKQDSGSRVWERVENFEGSKRGPNGATAKTGSTQGSVGAPRSGTQNGTRGAGGSSKQMVTTKASADQQGIASKPGTVPNSVGASESSGIEQLDGAGEEEAADDGDPSGFRPDIGLGSSGKRSIPVEDHRSKKQKRSERDVPSDPEQLASRHWGISEPGAVIGLEREVRVDVEPNRYVIGKKHGVPLVDTDSREDTFVKVITVIDLQARDWGKPPQGFFWKPSLRFVIADGGDANYERIQSMFERAGLSTSREYPHDHPPETAETAKTPAPATTHTPVPAAPKTSRRLFKGIMR